MSSCKESSSFVKPFSYGPLSPHLRKPPVTRYEQDFDIKFNKQKAALESADQRPDRTLVDKELDSLAELFKGLKSKLSKP